MLLAMDLGILTQINLIFYIILGLAVLMGFLGGLKKSLFRFITMAIFYIAFFITINQIVNIFWSMDASWLGSILANFDSRLSGFVSFDKSLELLLQVFLGDTINISSSSVEVIALATGLAKFFIKIIWTVLYFTVILIIYKIICSIIRIIFFKTNKDAAKNSGMGTIIGLANGLMAVFVMLIMLGGIMSTVESATVLFNSSSTGGGTSLAFVDNFNPVESVIPLSNTTTEFDATIDGLNNMVDSYNNNILVKIANSITVKSSIDSEVEEPLNLSLFDKVSSFDYDGETIGIRYELKVFSNAGVIFINSDYYQTKDITDITGDEIRDIFSELSNSKLVVKLIPVAIEVASESYDQDLGISLDALYAIDYEQELTNIASIGGTLFDILNGAGFIAGTGSVDQIAIDGDTVRDLFQDISGSDVILLVTDNVLFPMLEEQTGSLSTIITVPADLDLPAEYLALGEIFAQIIDADISFSDLENADVGVLLNAVSKIDLTTLTNSKLVSQALINILSGQTDIEGLDILEIPNNIVWQDNGGSSGELTKILTSLNILADANDGIDLNNLDVNILTNLDNADINTFFNSYVIRATISSIITSMDLGTDFPIVIPDSVYDSQNYFTQTELTNMIESIKLILTTSGNDFDVMQALSLTDSEIDTLLASDILSATIGEEIYNLGSDMLVVPVSSTTQVLVNSQSETVINKIEIKNILKALSVLEIDNFDTMSFDASIISVLENDTQSDLSNSKLSTLLGSSIIQATISQMILDLDVSSGGVLTIPDKDFNNNDVTYLVGGTNYITTDEIKNIFKALYNVGINDFSNLGFEDTTLLLNNMGLMLDSAILHATISDSIVNSASSAIIIPDSVIVISGSQKYITKTELVAFIDSLNELGLTDFDTFGFDAGDLFSLGDLSTFFDSKIMQATTSDYIIDSGVLTIPMTVKENISVNSVAGEMISKVELINIFTALDLLNMDNFTDGVNSSVVQAISKQDLNIILDSASFHVTIDEMIRGNANIGTNIPALANYPGGLYGVDPLTTKTEILEFMEAVKQFDGADFQTISFDATTIANMDAAKRDEVLDSMIVRFILTDQLETMMLADDPADSYWPNNSDYMNGDPSTFLTEAGINNVLTHYGMI